MGIARANYPSRFSFAFGRYSQIPGSDVVLGDSIFLLPRDAARGASRCFGVLDFERELLGGGGCSWEIGGLWTLRAMRNEGNFRTLALRRMKRWNMENFCAALGFVCRLVAEIVVRKNRKQI